MQISNSRTKAANCRKCEFCETVLNTRLVNAYSQHCLEEHDRSLFTCPQCGDVFHLQTHFKEHLIADHSLDEVNEFVTQNLWREFVHNGELMAECRYCYLVFRTQNSCTRHEKLHLKELQQRCYQDDGLSSKVSYGHPKPRCPPNMENYTRYCNICYRIVSKRNFREHMASHNSVREHSCPVCKKTFKVRRTATRHIQTHVNASNLKRKCYECDAVLSSESDIPDHYSSEHPTICPYRCPICGDGFMDKLPLKRHCHTHTDADRLEVSLKQPLISYKIDHACIYECTACYRSFNTKRATIAHWIVHTDRPYKCPQCHATFRIEDKLEQHTMDAHQQQVDEVESPL
ncbi:zinc finger protein 528-like [Anopheles nili]|uniref:zinc finger protein 528-like n=1 Tax=Anopheles nili TaxID=185578 RepID=UPI00237A78BC|nr:zinc finger protein 528-like [Anopheles nili]